MLKLRPYRAEDAEAIVTWTGDEYAFRQWCADRFDHYPITAEDMNRQYTEACRTGRFFPLTAEDENGPAGHLIMRYPDETGTVLRFGFVILDPARRGKGQGKEMLRLALDKAFGEMKAEKVTLGVFENNPAAYRCYRAAGFREAPAERKGYYTIFGEQWGCLEMEKRAEDA